jgi:hypothetical protein
VTPTEEPSVESSSAGVRATPRRAAEHRGPRRRPACTGRRSGAPLSMP